MIKILLSTTISLPLIFGQFLFTNTADPPPYSTTAVVTLVGAKIAAQKDVVKNTKEKIVLCVKEKAGILAVTE